MIKENLEEVEARITRACERSGRERSEVTLISVSKTKPVEMLQEAYDAGSRDSAKTSHRRSGKNIRSFPLISAGI